MKTIALGSLALTLLSMATFASAQPPADGGARHGGRHGGHGLPPILQALDTDHNGEISAAEMANAPASLKALDLNDDGVFSTEELLAYRPSRAAAAPAGATPHAVRTRPALPVMLALDANADGIISAVEIANAVASLKALDLNGDGMLTPDELRPLPPAGK